MNDSGHEVPACYLVILVAHYHLTCHKNNINAIIINAIINAAYQLKNVEAGLKVIDSIYIVL